MEDQEERLPDGCWNDDAGGSFNSKQQTVDISPHTSQYCWTVQKTPAYFGPSVEDEPLYSQQHQAAVSLCMHVSQLSVAECNVVIS